MPMYDYQCDVCGYEWEEFHAIDETARDCPDCESHNIHKRITTAPTIAGGVMTHAGDGKIATQEQLRRKWAEETPKLRKKLLAKYGEKAVRHMPTLNNQYDND
jgi:putative FmdB family regulatory protein